MKSDSASSSLNPGDAELRFRSGHLFFRVCSIVLPGLWLWLAFGFGSFSLMPIVGAFVLVLLGRVFWSSIAITKTAVHADVLTPGGRKQMTIEWTKVYPVMRDFPDLESLSLESLCFEDDHEPSPRRLFLSAEGPKSHGWREQVVPVADSRLAAAARFLEIPIPRRIEDYDPGIHRTRFAKTSANRPFRSRGDLYADPQWVTPHAIYLMALILTAMALFAWLRG